MGNSLGLLLYGGGGAALGGAVAGIGGLLVGAGAGIALHQLGPRFGLDIPLAGGDGKGIGAVFGEGGFLGKDGPLDTLVGAPVALVKEIGKEGGALDSVADFVGGAVVKAGSGVGKGLAKGASAVSTGAKNGVAASVGFAQGLGRKIGSIPKPKLKIKPIKLPKIKLF